MDAFKAFRIFQNADNTSGGKLVELGLKDLDAGEVVIAAHYSSVNYKDALAATGAGKVVRRFPCVGGIDVSGKVISSSDARFKNGDEVLVTGYDMGVAHDGGYAEYVRVPADWVVPLPKGMSLFDAMALGTAGFTAALAIYRMEQNELVPEKGKIIVTGATGGVSTLAIQMLAQLGYQVVAVTGKRSEQGFLTALGANEVLFRDELEMGTRPMEKALWAGAMDSVGGETLAWLTRTMKQDGVIASYGNAGGMALETTVLPFILRGVRLLGIDSVAAAMPVRQLVWQRLATDLRPALIDRIVTTIPLNELPKVFPLLVQGKMRGRTVVGINANG
jgi:NADPH2:quinone reductase